MKTLFITVELAPFAKVGGLADVAFSLPRALNELGVETHIAIPAYPMLLNHKELKVVKKDHKVLEKKGINLYETHINTCKVWLIEGREGDFKDSVSSDTLYAVDRDAYLRFSESLFEVCNAMQWKPDVFHCNDWHTGFIPVLLKERWINTFSNSASVFTIHNLGYQGEFGEDTLDVIDLPRSLYRMDKTESFGSVNFLKSGCVYSDVVNTVSENYAKEIQRPEYGCRLEGLMKHLYSQERLFGIVNGIDIDFFSAEKDSSIAMNFNPLNTEGKEVCKATVQQEMGWKKSTKLLATMVTRLSSQKGFHYILESLKLLEEKNIQLIILAKGDEHLANELEKIEKEKPELLRIFNKFDADLAQRLYAGADVILMPSNYEPCGLGQMIAMRYGTLPLVRKTGGLADTVKDLYNGFVFEAQDVSEFQNTVNRIAYIYNEEREIWEKMVRQAMETDFSWKKSALKYQKLYQKAQMVSQINRKKESEVA